jgi:hypothetical protein
MPIPGRDANERGIWPGDVDLIEAVISPRHDRPVGLKAQAVRKAGRDGHEPAVRRGHVRLALIVQSPRHDRAVGLETQTVHAAGRDGHEPAVRRGHVALTGVVPAPRHDRAVGLEAHVVIRASRDGHQVSERRLRNSSLLAPPDNRAARLRLKLLNGASKRQPENKQGRRCLTHTLMQSHSWSSDVVFHGPRGRSRERGRPVRNADENHANPGRHKVQASLLPRPAGVCPIFRAGYDGAVPAWRRRVWR